jgi:ATP adenylyltransferase
MDQVFAPWRMDWVEREGNEDYDGCVFCALPAEEPAREHNVVAHSEHAYVLLNNYPYNPGHVMVIPDEHVGDYRALSETVLLDHGRLLQRTLDALEKGLGPDGYNVGYNLGGPSAGGSIPDHLHAHVVPRFEGDTNFMPVLSETTVIVEAVAETWDRLHEAFRAQEGASAPADDAAVDLT